MTFVRIPRDEHSDVVDFLQRHVVPVYLEFRRGEQSAYRLFTSFLFSVSDQWMLFTAGHCIDAVNENIANGFRIERCLLLDGLRESAKHREPIPINWADSTATNLGANEQADYGILFLKNNTRRLLEANSLAPFSEECWDCDPEVGDAYKLIGIPSELSDVSRLEVRVSLTLHAVTELSARPDCFAETDVPMLYGEVFLPAAMTDIDGTSGGPILAFQQIENGFRYRLHAIQAAWDPPTKSIRAPLIRPLGVLLRNIQRGEDSPSG